MSQRAADDFVSIHRALEQIERDAEERRNRVVNEPTPDPYEAKEPTKPWPYGAWGATSTNVDDVYCCYQPSNEELASALHSWDKAQTAEQDAFRNWQREYAQYLVFHRNNNRGEA